MKNKYLLFAGHRYYPEGGIADYWGSWNSTSEANNWFHNNSKVISRGNYIDNWGQIVDRDTFEIIEELFMEKPLKRRG